jgi:hypothetical protein
LKKTFSADKIGEKESASSLTLCIKFRGNAEMSNGMHVTAILATSGKPLQEIFLYCHSDVFYFDLLVSNSSNECMNQKAT